jgi:hypothetical protein
MHRGNADWMAELAEEIGQRRLCDVLLPGTHGSCTYAISEGSPPSPDCPAALRALLAFLSSPSTHACVPAEILASLRSTLTRLCRLQVRTVAQQLEAGIRYLEIQVAPRPERSWNVLNVTRLTGLPKIRGRPASLVHRRQHHIVYRDVSGDVWDISYGGWQVDDLTQTKCGPPASALTASVRDRMLHLAYRDGNDHVCLLSGQERWKGQDLTDVCGCPRAAGAPVILHWRGEGRIFFRDAVGRLWQLSETEHRWSSLDLSELVQLPRVFGDPTTLQRDGQVSVFCRDVSGGIHELWYDGRWNHRALDRAVKAPAAATSPVGVAEEKGRRLFYRDIEGAIWEVHEDGEHWRSRDLSKLTAATGAASDMCVVRYRERLDVIYCDVAGDLCALRDEGGWRWHNLTQTVGADKAMGTPAAIVHRGDLHVLHRDVNGDVCDLYQTSGGAWAAQNLTQVSGSAKGLRDPLCAEYQGRLHVLFQGEGGVIRDLRYDAGHWDSTRLTRPPGRCKAAADPVAIEHRGRWHVALRDAAGGLRELSGDRAWQSQDLLELTGAPPPANDPSLSVLGLQQHVVYRDSENSLWHLRYDPHEGWNAVDLTRASGAPAAAGNPLSVQYHSEHHVVYRDAHGQVWDLCPVTGSAHNLTRATRAARAAGDVAAVLCEGEPRLYYRDTAGGLTEIGLEGAWKSRPVIHDIGRALPAGEPTAAVYHGSVHVVYRDRAGHLRHLSQDRAWEMQDLTELTRCPKAGADPLLATGADDELHVLYQDRAGDLHDVYYAQETLYACRMLFAERTEKVIGAVAAFLARHRKEIVVLDFNGFDEMTQRCHEALAHQLLAAFGPMLVALPRARLPEVTLEELWRSGQRVLVLYDYEPATKSVPQLWFSGRREHGERHGGAVSAPAVAPGDAEILKTRLARAIDASRGRSGLFVLNGTIVPELPHSWSAWTGDAFAPTAVAQRVSETMRGLERKLLERDRAVPPLVARWVRDEWSGRDLNIVVVDHFEQCDLVDVVKLLNGRHRTS